MNPKKLIGCLLGVVCSQLLSTAAKEEGGISVGLQVMGNDNTTRSPFLAQHGCSVEWTSWPSLQAAGAKENTFLAFKMINVVGNLFLTLSQLIRVARFLGVGVVLDSSPLPGFRVAFDPSEIMWDVSYEPIIERARGVERDVTDGDAGTIGMHSLTFHDGALILSEDQFSRLESALQTNASTLPELISLLYDERVPNMRRLVSVLGRSLPTLTAPKVEPCAWNMMFSRSPALVEKLAELSPWESSYHPDAYVAWHLRTVDSGDRAQGYKADVHTYMITEAAPVVCPIFEQATVDIQAACTSLFSGDLDVFVSANSKDLARECIADMAADGLHGGQIALGGETHTYFPDEDASMNAFLDFMSLIDATAIVRTGSSFSGMVVAIRDMACKAVLDTVLTPRRLAICTPRDMSC
ncbi:unnamed protein product [Ectocarpus sp. 8 AP-2014]